MANNPSNVLVTRDLAAELTARVAQVPSGQLFILTDQTTRRQCLPALRQIPALAQAPVFSMEDGDDAKNIDTVIRLWQWLGENGGTRKSMLINLGGGVVTDLGGFAANTFKRGIRYINLPTSLLSMVDAAVGGKTGINFNGLKNEIGVIHAAEAVLIDAGFLTTLDAQNLLSGFAEMLKHGLLDTPSHLDRLLAFDFQQPDFDSLSGLITLSLAVKQRIVEQDPTEKGIRKSLNLGHTIGHAFESFSHSQQRPLLHGYAVAYGMIAELFLAHKLCGFPQKQLVEVVRFIRENYGAFEIACKDYPTLYDLMCHDKKNDAVGKINFTLLDDVGQVHLDCHTTQDLIYQGLDFYRDSVGL